MSVELYKKELRVRRQEVIIGRMRTAIRDLAQIADGLAQSFGVAYPYAASGISDLRAVSDLTIEDVAREYGSHPPEIESSDRDDDREG